MFMGNEINNMPRENPNGSQIFGLLLVAGGAYLLYEYFFATPSSGPTSTPGSTTAGNTSSTTSTSLTNGSNSSTNVNSATGASTAAAPTSSYYSWMVSQILSIAGVSSNQLYTPIQWAYYHGKLVGSATSPSSAQLGLDANTPITVQTYVNAYQSKGLTGLGCLNCGMGDLSYTSRVYNAMNNRTPGMAIGDFGVPRANKIERATKVVQ